MSVVPARNEADSSRRRCRRCWGRISGRARPDGWAGKVWAMSQGLAAVSAP